jgi:hypothetical protein
MSAMSGVEQSEGGTQSDRTSETGALPEGAAVDPGSPAGAAQRDGLPALFPHSQPTGNLDLLVSMNEPESLIRELKVIAIQFPAEDKRWLGVRRLCERAEEYFEHISKPAPNRPQT